MQVLRVQAARITPLPGFTAGMWAIAAAALATAAIYAGTQLEHGLALLVLLAVTGFLTERFDVEVTPQLWISSSAVVTIVAAVLLGPVGAGAVGFAELLSDVDEPPISRWLVHAPLRTLCGVSAGVAASVDASLAVKVAFAAITCLTVDAAGNALILWLRHRDNIAYLRTLAVALYLPCVLYLPAIVVVVLAYNRYDLAGLALILSPVVLAQYVLRLVIGSRQLSDTLTEANLSFAISMVRALEAADAYTAGHSAAVGVYARDVALELGYQPEGAALVQLAALLHDVGKIGVPTEILHKPTRLSDEEWSAIQRHPRTGEEIVREVPVFRHVAQAIRHHHERPDGTGYPDGLHLEQIPRAALIIGATDAYSAMTQPRAYRPAWSPLEAIRELRRCAGTQFDGSVVEALLRVLDRHDDSYRDGMDDVFGVLRQRTEILSQLGNAGALRGAAAIV
jgi:putative nucleotidyltransferase with HDIG domain